MQETSGCVTAYNACVLQNYEKLRLLMSKLHDDMDTAAKHNLEQMCFLAW